ncbi:MAG: M48 family metalloprotease [Alphaproteobacteria bacterium]|nr:M48 family metalloprotease [Alphaproteobacteria bacterium]
MIRQVFKFSLFGLWLLLAHSPAINAQNIVRDTEIENFLQKLSVPVFQAAGYGKTQIRFILVADKRLNAFVAGGDAIFVHTGLIVTADTHEQITAVIAHELGHILAGHVTQTLQSQQNSSKIALATALTALAIGFGTNNIDAAIVGSLGGADTAQKTYLKGSRLRETAADQIAVDLLNRAEMPLYPMRDFMSYLAQREQGAQFDEYSLTHPPSKDRLSFIAHQHDISPYKDKRERAEFREWHQRIKVKIIAYDERPSDIIKRYDSDSDRDIYARSIAYYRNKQYPQALSLLNNLLNKNSEDPYLWELRGDILFAAYNYDAAIEAYLTAKKILKNAPLLDYQLALSLSQQSFDIIGQDETVDESVKKNLKRAQIYAYRAKNKDPYIVQSWQLISKIHGRLGDAGNRDLALAEYHFRIGEWDIADQLAQKSLDGFADGAPGLVRAEDILLQIDQILREQQQQ